METEFEGYRVAYDSRYPQILIPNHGWTMGYAIENMVKQRLADGPRVLNMKKVYPAYSVSIYELIMALRALRRYAKQTEEHQWAME